MSFDDFWDNYPSKRRIAKPYTRECYIKLLNKARKAGEDVDEVANRIEAGLVWFKIKWEEEKTEDKHIPHASSFLNRGYWDIDEEDTRPFNQYDWYAKMLELCKTNEWWRGYFHRTYWTKPDLPKDLKEKYKDLFDEL